MCLVLFESLGVEGVGERVRGEVERDGRERVGGGEGTVVEEAVGEVLEAVKSKVKRITKREEEKEEHIRAEVPVLEGKGKGGGLQRYGWWERWREIIGWREGGGVAVLLMGLFVLGKLRRRR